MSNEYPALNHSDLTEQTHAVLRERILTRELAPREKISVDEVASRLGVSRTPVITALQRLASEGLVEIVPRRGTFVTGLTTRDVAELFDIRLMIELHAAEQVLKEGKATELLQSVQKAMDDMQQAMDNNGYRDYQAFMAGDRDLHTTLVKLTGNDHLWEIYSNLNVHIQVARAHYLDNVESARQAQREHNVIVNAFQKGDAEEVREALATHILNVKGRILQILTERGYASGASPE